MKIILHAGTWRQDAEIEKIENALRGNKIVGDELERVTAETWHTEDFIDNHKATDFAEELDLNLKAYFCNEYTIEIQF